MAHFKALKSDFNTYKKCLYAIETACSSELWLDNFIKSCTQKNMIDSTYNVLLHWWKAFLETDIDFMYISRSKAEAAFYYEDSTGRYINISEQTKGSAHVYNSNGFPDSFIDEIEGSSYEKLYEIIDNKLFNIIDINDFDLEISCTDRV